VTRSYLETEQDWQARTSNMALADIDDLLTRLSPAAEDTRTIVGRAVAMKRRIELANASRPNPQDPPPDPAGLIEVYLPEGGPNCVQSRDMRAKYYYAVEMPDGRRVIRMPWHEFYRLAFSIHNGAGPNGACWLDCNPSLVDRFPKNPPPPPAAPYEERG
jgi:hypothetical protein